MLTIQQITESVKIVASEFPILKVYLFGSYAEDRNTPESDVDLLVEFTSETISLITLAALKNRLEELLGTDVDVIHAPLPNGSIINPTKVVPLYAA